MGTCLFKSQWPNVWRPHSCLRMFMTKVLEGVLMRHGLFVCLCFSYPIFENPYPLTIHESPVTCCEYVADCPVDLIPALYSVGSRQKRQGYSKKVGRHTSAGVRRNFGTHPRDCILMRDENLDLGVEQKDLQGSWWGNSSRISRKSKSVRRYRKKLQESTESVDFKQTPLFVHPLEIAVFLHKSVLK